MSEASCHNNEQVRVNVGVLAKREQLPVTKAKQTSGTLYAVWPAASRGGRTNSVLRLKSAFLTTKLMKTMNYSILPSMDKSEADSEASGMGVCHSAAFSVETLMRHFLPNVVLDS